MFRCFSIASFSILCLASLHAEPAWKSELTSPTLGPHPALTATTLRLEVSWKGMINSGNLKIEFAPPDVTKRSTFIVRSSAVSTGAAAVLFPYSSNFWSELNATTLRPRFFHSVEADHQEATDSSTQFLGDRVEGHEVTKLLATGVSTAADHVFKFAPVFDIFSAMLHIRSQKLDSGDRIVIVVCPFNAPYLLRIKVLGREWHNGRNTIRLSLGMQKIDRDTLELRAYKKLKSDATLWLSDDAARIPIEFRAAAFIGDVRATLTKHTQP
jgi:Protein of unknown function (DUF3108)